MLYFDSVKVSTSSLIRIQRHILFYLLAYPQLWSMITLLYLIQIVISSQESDHVDN